MFSTSAAVLYIGKVMHARLRPISHRFTYRVISLLIDLDRLEEADCQSHLFGVNRAAFISFRESDYGKRDCGSLSKYVRRLAAEHGTDLADGSIQLLCYPRMLGYTFNPLSIYFCYAASGDLVLLIYEVRNTFGETHSYILPVPSTPARGGEIRQRQVKEFYVSPFMPMETQYHFRISTPAERVGVRILQTDQEGPLFAATFSGRRRELTSRSLLAAFAAIPFFTLKVVLGIHWEAVQLWLKGASIVPKPNLRQY